MYRRVITWTRPSADVKWPWEDQQSKVTIDDILEAMDAADGFIAKTTVSETDLVLISNNDWVSKEHWSVYNNTSAVIALHDALDSIVAQTNITKTVTEVV